MSDGIGAAHCGQRFIVHRDTRRRLFAAQRFTETVGAVDDTHGMHLVDFIDAATELAPRQWKRYAAIALVAAFVLVPDRAADALAWYATEKADQIVEAVLDSEVPSPASSPTGTATTP